MRRTIQLGLILFLFVNTCWAQAHDPPPQAEGSAASADASNQPVTEGDSTKLEPVKTRQPVYPTQARQEGIQGQVLLDVDVSETGDVENVKVISGEPILAKAAVDAVRKWKFKPFIKNGKAVKASTRIPIDFYFSSKVMSKGVSADGTATTNSDSIGTALPKPTPPDSDLGSAPRDQESGKTVAVSQGVAQGMLIHSVAPVYPESARRKYIQGTVVLRAVIDKQGQVTDLKPISGPSELVPAAIGAVQQWRYRPFELRGQSVEIETQITVNFRLR